MAYVESFYLENENALAPPAFTKGLIEAQLVVNPQEFHEDIRVNLKTPPVSDYCGFESDEVPPVYRAQLRMIQKNKALAAENAVKSAYAYENQSEIKPNIENENAVEPKIGNALSNQVEFYVPGFSPPPQENNEVQKRNEFQLPQFEPIEVTEHVFLFSRSNEASQYVLMQDEDPKMVNIPKKSDTDSLISYTASDLTSTNMSTANSCITASLGPGYGFFSADTSQPSEDKYKGLSAFRPVTNSIESQYALPDLN